MNRIINVVCLVGSIADIITLAITIIKKRNIRRGIIH